MACREIRSGGVQGFICGRSGKGPSTCSVNGCGGRVARLCDYPLTGRAAGRTCDRALCAAHAKSVSEGVDYCPVHHLMHHQKGA